ncbi:hypothetical protein, partial [Novosphingobium sp.]|uniref:hypothetical protein n=1 Tax=Novosphingobium sp. TaxID=1874826 RepID=UPI0026025A8C
SMSLSLPSWISFNCAAMACFPLLEMADMNRQHQPCTQFVLMEQGGNEIPRKIGGNALYNADNPQEFPPAPLIPPGLTPNFCRNGAKIYRSGPIRSGPDLIPARRGKAGPSDREMPRLRCRPD